MRVGVTVRCGHRHTSHGRISAIWRLYNSNNFAISAALAEVCALLTFVTDKCVLLTLERSLSTGRPAVSETGPSQLLEPECETVCRQT